MALIKPTTDEKKQIRKALVGWARSKGNANQKIMTGEAHRVFFQVLSEMGLPTSQVAGFRAPKPNYTELGMTRKAGAPTAAEIKKYAEVTDGGDLGKDGYVTNVLLFDNDLITDRSAVITYNALAELMGKYLGRANDYNHSFDAKDSSSRIIDLQMGYDPGVMLHPDRPTATLAQLGGANPFDQVYVAIWATLAMPNLAGSDAIDRVKKALTKDVSIAWSTAEGSVLCSICLEPLTQGMCFSWCEEHGFPGGRDEETGELMVSVMNGVDDAFTFGFVSDGAVKRAGIVNDPTGGADDGDDPEPDHDPDDNAGAYFLEEGPYLTSTGLVWPPIQAPFQQPYIVRYEPSTSGNIGDGRVALSVSKPTRPRRFRRS